VAGLSASITQPPVGSLLALGHGIALDLGDGVLNGGVGDGQSGADAGSETLTLAVSQSGLDGLDLLGGRVELLELTALAGEEDQAGLVVLQAGDVGDQGLLGVVGAAVVNRDADGGSELLGDTGFLRNSKSLSPIFFFMTREYYLQLSQGETTTGTDTAVVLDGRASHNGTQLVHRTGSNGSSLSETSLTTTVLPAGLSQKKVPC